ncbi:MAG: sigma-70 family RNA polymerase sigma factor [Candidatus Tectomicrobia bacterium]|uniref:RNA polymerase sigma factor n=1 Tax=Tectimicrobiota bacterium TaxID=2528274 RepID=A0A932MQU5_UNCTE|nr:sigma-70 family RNA polymerase sigma factor [Candidatus Tectomicrobia bacterium]
MLISDRRCFEEEALRHLDSVYRGALRLARDPVEADDLVQEVYLKALRFFHQFEPGSNCRAWLFRILRNTYINQYRHRSKLPPHEDLVDAEGALQEFGLESFHSAGKGPEAEVIRKLTFEQLDQALNRLPGKFRQILILSEVEGFSYKEIAKIEGCPLGTVMSRLWRARRMLQQCLAPLNQPLPKNSPKNSCALQAIQAK